MYCQCQTVKFSVLGEAEHNEPVFYGHSSRCELCVVSRRHEKLRQNYSEGHKSVPRVCRPEKFNEGYREIPKTEWRK